jgi:DNA-binding response OmpR family regulator
MAHKILVADDEEKIAAMVAGFLEASGFTVIRSHDGIDALKRFHDSEPDCLILDINMPLLDGLSVAKEVRRTSSVPIIFLTARTDEIDRIVGLELGADDYVCKPFSPRELVARVKAVLRRTGQKTEGGKELLVRGGVALDPAKRTLSVAGRSVHLTAVQFDIFLCMMREPGRVWSRLDILEASSLSAYEGYERTIDAHVKNIRKILGDDSDRPRYIETVRGVGYRFMEQKDEA